jgi:tetratricopeptide (TPR) repeat protein
MAPAIISRKRILSVLAVACLIPIAITTGCSDSESPGGDADLLIREGWAHFQAEDYQAALSKFNQATTDPDHKRDAYDGLGWAYSRLGQLENAEDAFLYVLGELVDPSRETYTGASIVSLALKNYVRAEENSNWAIERYEEEYEFRYDPAVTHITLRLVRSIARFHLGDYASSYADVVVLDDLLGLGLPTLNTGSPNFVARLLSQIQAIREASGGGLL